MATASISTLARSSNRPLTPAKVIKVNDDLFLMKRSSSFTLPGNGGPCVCDDEQVDFHNVLDRPACGADNRDDIAQGPIKLLDKIVADQPALRVIADLTRNIQASGRCRLRRG